MDRDAFVEPAVRFSLRKPASWRFLPPAWSPVAHLRNASGPDDWIRHARSPFCCASGHHDSPLHAYPTLQATVRPSGVPGNEQARAILQGQLDFLAGEYLEFVPFEATSEAVIGGCRANVIKARFALPAEIDGAPLTMTVISRSYTVFAPGRTFSLGLSSSGDADYYDESQFQSIVASIRIGA